MKVTLTSSYQLGVVAHNVEFKRDDLKPPWAAKVGRRSTDDYRFALLPESSSSSKV